MTNSLIAHTKCDKEIHNFTNIHSSKYMLRLLRNLFPTHDTGIKHYKINFVGSKLDQSVSNNNFRR